MKIMKKYLDLEPELIFFLPWFQGDVGVFSFWRRFLVNGTIILWLGCLECAQDTISYNASISACRYHWRLAIHLMKRQFGGPRSNDNRCFGSIRVNRSMAQLQEEGVSRQLCSYDLFFPQTLIHMLYKLAHPWYKSRHSHSVQPNVISYNATISACEKSFEWRPRMWIGDGASEQTKELQSPNSVSLRIYIYIYILWVPSSKWFFLVSVVNW